MGAECESFARHMKAPTALHSAFVISRVVVHVMQNLIHERTDRELLVGIFNAVCALAEKLTGEKLVVFLPSAAGDWPYSGVPCAWLPKDQPAAVPNPVARHEFEHSSMQS